MLIQEVDKTMNDALRQALVLLYGTELEELAQKRDKAVQRVKELQLVHDRLVRERDEALEKVKELQLVRERNEAFRILAKLVAGVDSGGIDAETLAEARRFVDTFEAGSPSTLTACDTNGGCWTVRSTS